MRFTDNTAQSQSQRTITKDGYLVVPASISKLGVFEYLAKELGLQGEDIKRVARTEASLFSDETIKSFENATLTLGHPAEGVNAENWKKLSVGIVRNVKRVGDELQAEAWVFDADAIKAVQEQGIDELSCGYDCDIKPSEKDGADFEMSPMIGNHVAIVAKGRCGSGVKLADEDKSFMAKTSKFFDALLGAFGVKLSDEQKQQIDKQDEPGNPPVGNPSQEPPKSGEQPQKQDETMIEEEFKKQLAEKDAEIARLKSEQAEKEANAEQSATLADAKTHFPSVQFSDSAKVREIKELAVVASGIFTKDEAAKLTDEAMAGAYQAAKAVSAKLADKSQELGKVLLGDSKPVSTPTFDFNKMYGGE